MRLVCGTVAVLAFSVPASLAFAADLPVKAPMMAPVSVYNWTGFYAGVNVGYSWGRDRSDITGNTTVATRTRDFRTAGPDLISDTTTVAGPFGFTGTGATNIDGFIGGGQIGHNWQFNRSWVVGLEADIQASGERGSFNVCAGGVGCSIVGTADYRLNWFGTARARLGWLPTDRIMLYATGGLAYGELDSSYNVGLVGFPGVGFGSKELRAGYTVGGGIEGALWGNWTAKAEYLFMDLGSFGATGGGFSSTTSINLLNTPQGGFNRVIDTTTTGSATISNRFQDHIFRIGLNYRFAPDAVVARY